MKIHLELFTANICSRCSDAKSMLQDIVSELDDYRLGLDYIDVVKELDHAVETGVLATPALALNGKLLFCPLPEKAKVLQAIQTELAR